NNPWFPRENIIYSLKAIASSLSKDNLEKWLSPYSDKALSTASKKVAVIMAGNIPLVGFHDFLSVLISGNIFIGKLSSQDKFLLPALANELIAIEPSIKNNIIFTEGRLPAFDAVIATGSNNSSRYFEYYFGKYPHIIRKSRTSIAIISGKESVEELRSLCDDIFLYFGLGCRNVNKLYIPQNYDFTVLKKAIGTYRDKLFTHNKFMNNYEYNLSVFLINQISHIDTGFCLLKNDASFASPISVINYEYYSDITDVLNNISANREKIQCIVGGKSYTNDTVTFGKSQQPELWDYADGVNTMKFLIEL
ncbi:MAG: acyl-CoA reductase, partial [Bacteroidetes bacterium]|nr:acyl-CoA reductase [Bacteroidota bacterium]